MDDMTRKLVEQVERLSEDRIERNARIAELERENERLRSGLRRIVELGDDPMRPAAPYARAVLEDAEL